MLGDVVLEFVIQMLYKLYMSYITEPVVKCYLLKIT